MWRKKIFEKIDSLPEPKRTQALLELELHDYYSARAKRHNILITDTPHPAMRVNGNGNWIV